MLHSAKAPQQSENRAPSKPAARMPLKSPSGVLIIPIRTSTTCKELSTSPWSQHTAASTAQYVQYRRRSRSPVGLFSVQT